LAHIERMRSLRPAYTAILLIGSSPSWANAAEPIWVLPGADLDLNFTLNRYWQRGVGSSSITELLKVSRETPETTLVPSSPNGARYLRFENNVAAIAPGVGLQIYEGRTNYLLHSTTPATQTTANLAAGTYTLWDNGLGRATPSAGTATGCTGFAPATQGKPDTFTCAGSGTIVVTVSGTLNAFQLENGAGGTPLIVTGGGSTTRVPDVITVATSPSFAQALTVLAVATPRMPTSYDTVQTPVQIDDGDNNQRIDIDRGANSGLLGGGVTSNSTGWGAPGVAVWPQNSQWAVAYALKTNDQAMVGAGVLSTYEGTTEMFAPARVVVGANGNGIHQLDGTIQRLTVWPTRRLSNRFLQQIAP
jgi:hypothetical protein